MKKNIHVLATDQPSRLAKVIDHRIEEFRFNSDFYQKIKFTETNQEYLPQNLVITSLEKIKEGDWCMSLCDDESYEEIYQCNNIGLVDDEDKKIILSTDPFLITDGVQEIDDTFLEWFVDNPTCEYVEIESWETKGEWDLDYKIIIPKEEPKYIEDKFEFESRIINEVWDRDEEPKQDVPGIGLETFQLVLDEKSYPFRVEKPKQYPIGGYAPGSYYCTCVSCKTMFQGDKRSTRCGLCAIKSTQEESKQDCLSLPNCTCQEPDLDTMKGLCNVCGNSIIHLGKRITITKQETLEEAAEIDLSNLCCYDKRNPDYIPYNEDNLTEMPKDCHCDNCFYGRTKLTEQFIIQVVRRYSEEEVIQLLIKFNQEIREVEDVRSWFEQFKKK